MRTTTSYEFESLEIKATEEIKKVTGVTSDTIYIRVEVTAWLEYEQISEDDFTSNSGIEFDSIQYYLDEDVIGRDFPKMSDGFMKALTGFIETELEAEASNAAEAAAEDRYYSQE